MLPMEEELRRRRLFPFVRQNVQSYVRKTPHVSFPELSPREKDETKAASTMTLDCVPGRMETKSKFRKQKSNFTQTAISNAKNKTVSKNKNEKIKRGDSLASLANPMEFVELAPETMEPLCEIPNVRIPNLSPFATPPVSRKCKRTCKVTQPKVDCWLKYNPRIREVNSKKKETSLKLRAMLNVVDCLLEDDNRTNEKPQVKSKGCLLALQRELNFCLNNKILMIPSSTDLPALYEPRTNYKEFNPRRNRYGYVRSKIHSTSEPSAYNNTEPPSVDISGKVRHHTRYIPIVDPTTDIVETKLTVRPKPVDKLSECINKSKQNLRSHDEHYDILVSYRIGKSAVEHYKRSSDHDEDYLPNAENDKNKVIELKLSNFLKDMFSISPKSLFDDNKNENPSSVGIKGLVELEHELNQEKCTKVPEIMSSTYYKTKSLKRGKRCLFPGKTPLISSVKLSELIYDKKVGQKNMNKFTKSSLVVNSNCTGLKDERKKAPNMNIDLPAKLIATAESDVESFTSKSVIYHESQIRRLMKFLYEQDIKTKLQNIICDMSRKIRYRKLRASLVKLEEILDYLVAVYVLKNNISSDDNAPGTNEALGSRIYTESETDVKLNELTFTVGTIKNLLKNAFFVHPVKKSLDNVKEFSFLHPKKYSKEDMDVKPRTAFTPSTTDHKRSSVISNSKVHKRQLVGKNLKCSIVHQKNITAKEQGETKQKKLCLKNRGKSEYQISRKKSLNSVNFNLRKSQQNSMSKKESRASTFSKKLIRPVHVRIGNIKSVASMKRKNLKLASKEKHLCHSNKKNIDRKASQRKTKLTEDKNEKLDKKSSIVKGKNIKEHQFKKSKKDKESEPVLKSKSCKERRKLNKSNLKVIKKSLNFKPAQKSYSINKFYKRAKKLQVNQAELPKYVVGVKYYPHLKPNSLKTNCIKKKEQEKVVSSHNCKLRECVIKDIKSNPLAFKKVAQEVLERTFSRDSLKTILHQVINSGYIDGDNKQVQIGVAKEASVVKTFCIDEHDRMNKYLQTPKCFGIKGQPRKTLLTHTDRLNDFSKNDGNGGKALASTIKTDQHESLDESEKKSALLFHRLCTALTRSRNKMISDRVKSATSKNVKKSLFIQKPIETKDFQKSPFLEF